MILKRFSSGLFLAASLLSGACSNMTVQPETYDGLTLVPDTRFGAVYKRPGADLAEYDSYSIDSCEVAFRKNWMRSQNNGRMDLGSRVTQKDVDRIKGTLSAECDTYFREALEQAPSYHLVDSFDAGEQVLVLRPAIINLDIAAPTVAKAGVKRTYTTEAGEMTLALELLDRTTGEILVRIVDRKRGRNTGRMQWTNSVTNQADAKRVLGHWARQLREGLDEVTGGARTNE